MKKYELTIKQLNTKFKSEKITTSLKASDYIKQFYSDDIQIFESFFILLLNSGNETIGYAKISQGGVVGTIVDIKIICKYIIDTLAVGIILAHNHPSGRIKPSETDIKITEKICKAVELCDSKVIDHIILTKDSYYSFSDNGML